MNVKYLLIIVGFGSAALTLILSVIYPSSLTALSFLLSLFSVAMGLILAKESAKQTELLQDENREQHLDIINKIEESVKGPQKASYYQKRLAKSEKKTSKLEAANLKLRQLMERVSFQLKKEHLSKNSLLKRVDKPIYALLLFKGQEIDMNRTKAKPLRDKILPGLGFKFIKGSRGLYLLPPSRLPSFKDRPDLEHWIKNNIYSSIPKNFRYIIPYITLIDLRFTFSKKEDKLSKKYDLLLDAISSEELLTFSEGLSYLQRKKKLSLQDLINIPNFLFWSDNTSLSPKEKEKLTESNDKIVELIQKDLNREVFTKDVPDLETERLYEHMSKFVSITKEDVIAIKENAKFWVDLLEKKV